MKYQNCSAEVGLGKMADGRDNRDGTARPPATTTRLVLPLLTLTLTTGEIPKHAHVLRTQSMEAHMVTYPVDRAA